MLELLWNRGPWREFVSGNRKLWETRAVVNRKRAVNLPPRLAAAALPLLCAALACVQLPAPSVGENPIAAAPEVELPAPSPPTPLTEPADEASDLDPSALEDFRGTLEPHGRWLEHPVYGTVWVPHTSAVGTQFAPYATRGHWALTPDEQWLWVSDYPFGRVVFHYGRWVWTDRVGWVWVPGRRYSHAWVHFRVSDSTYVGWSPMPPRYVWRSGRAVWLASVPPSPYVFVDSRYAFYPAMHSQVITEHYRVRRLAARSRLYRPRHADSSDRYYSPPLRHTPTKARSAHRVEPPNEATTHRRFSDVRRPQPSARKAKPALAHTPRVRPQPASVGRSDKTLKTRRVVKKGAALPNPRPVLRASQPKPKETTRPRPKETTRLKSRPPEGPPARITPAPTRSSTRSHASGRVRPTPRRSR
ncbi:MAG: hypothetical protein RJA70_2619 [Pseudomonadota bacterium]